MKLRFHTFAFVTPSEMLARLKAWMEAQGLKTVSAPIYGYFDPPWTPAFLRRNEVMMRTDAGQ